MTYVLDSSAVLAFLAQESGWEIVERYLDQGGCLIHTVNVCEVMYNQQRILGAAGARQVIQALEDEGVIVRSDFDTPFLYIVSDYKAAPGQTALGDCFGLALAQRERLPFVTSDRHELTRVAARGTVTIEFIR